MIGVVYAVGNSDAAGYGVLIPKSALGAIGVYGLPLVLKFHTLEVSGAVAGVFDVAKDRGDNLATKTGLCHELRAW